MSRAGFYRSLQEQRPVQEEIEVRSAIQQIAVEHRRRYGYRRISAELPRRGMLVNHKRVARIMREDNLLAVQLRQEGSGIRIILERQRNSRPIVPGPGFVEAGGQTFTIFDTREASSRFFGSPVRNRIMSILEEMHPHRQFDSWREFEEVKRMLADPITEVGGKRVDIEDLKRSNHSIQ